MNKLELVEKVAEKVGCQKKEAEAAVSAIFDIIEDTLAEGESVRLLGFGTFEVRERSGRVGRNPQKPGEVIEIPASKAPAFKAGKALKAAVNK